jgi:hypothetical protein
MCDKKPKCVKVRVNIDNGIKNKLFQELKKVPYALYPKRDHTCLAGNPKFHRASIEHSFNNSTLSSTSLKKRQDISQLWHIVWELKKTNIEIRRK